MDTGHHRAAAWVAAGGVAIAWYQYDKKKAKDAESALSFSAEEQDKWNNQVKAIAPGLPPSDNNSNNNNNNSSAPKQ
jgi:hypothetical protein